MTTQEILEVADNLSSELIKNGVKKDYTDQIFCYILDLSKKKDEAQFRKNLKELMVKMPTSGFEKRSRRFEVQCIQTNRILNEFKVQQPLFDLPLADILQILGWTVKLMKYKEGGS